MGKASKASSSTPSPASASASAAGSAKDASSKPAAKGPSGARRGIVRSGNAGNSSSSSSATADTMKPDDGRPPPLFPAGYKTPMSLLNERCQKNGWQKPEVLPFSTPDGHGCIVKLTRIDPKNGAESVTLRPPTSADSPIRIEKETSLEAKHWASVYALHRFASGLQLGMVLPPQVRDYWAALQEEKRKGGPKDAWLYSADPFEAAATRNRAIAEATAAAAAASNGQDSGRSSGTSTPIGNKELPEIHMPSEMRAMVQDTIRTMRKLYPPVASEGAPPPYQFAKGEKLALAKEIVKLGYRQGHVASALDYISKTSASCDPLLEGLSTANLQQVVVQYLQIILSEEELPNNAHGYQGRPDANIRIAKHGDTAGLRLSWLVEKIVKEAGYPQEATEAAVAACDGDEARSLDMLMRRLVGWQDGRLDATNVDWPLIKEKRETEVDALQSMLGPDFYRVDDGIFDLTVQGKTPVTLRIILDESTAYPSPSGPNDEPHIPIFLITSSSGAVPAYIRLHLNALLLQRTKEDWLDILQGGEGGILYEIYTYLSEVLAEALSHPPPANEVLKHFRQGNNESDYAGLSRSSTPKPQRGSKMANGQARTGNHQALLQAEEKLRATPAYQSMLAKRNTLPAYKSRESLISLIQENRVVIVSGATGSGKTTQVPAYVLEDAISSGKGGAISIVCTQPRRISAIGVANRVAQERTEKIGEGLVGYAIRGERKASRDCRLLFCTTGILLQRLSRGGDPNLEGTSHVFVDEVHERSLDSDFLLLILKEVLARNPKIKVVLMSATADSQRFSSYFAGAPCIEIPGQTHPVQDFYLEDVLVATRYKAPSVKASRKYTEEENAELRASFAEQGIDDPETSSTLMMLARSERLDYDLVAATVVYLMSQSSVHEAILIFVTGVAEITQTMRAIERALSSKEAEILPLHANLTSAEQSRVFKHSSKRKIIVSTNVAETSITVDDVVFVIDTGRVKETRFDAESGLQRLVEDWNSLAGAKQRRGRAGRTKPGQCWKLYTRWRESKLPSHAQPEILRTPLASLVLQVKALRGEADVVDFLTGALDAPHIAAIQEALDTLERLGATEAGDSKTARLTPLGHNLALLPLDLQLGKMLILASIFGCLGPILTLCAALSTKSVFSAPPEKRDEAQAARAKFSTAKSDLLTDLTAIDSALQLKDQPSKFRHYCEDNFISQAALRELVSLRVDYVSALKSAGIAVDSDQKGSAPLEEAKHTLVKAIVYAGTAKAVRVKLPQTRYEATIGGAAAIDHEAREVRFFDTDGRVFIHPGSILFAESKLNNGYLTYFNKAVTSKPFLRDATELPLFALLIFGRDLKADVIKGGLTLDSGRIRLRAPPRTSILMNELRRLLDVELAAMIDEPELVQAEQSPVVKCILALLDKDL